ncbi:MAG: hypothetical protein QOH21_3818 [Acidobacteriota bacterium]|jgi:hypothetical protein|nr:hypothetical protein [Acidobacteriota bacterium]
MAKNTNQKLHEIARRVMRAQTAAPATAAGAADAMQVSCGALYRVLETALGPAGLQALIGRAIQITAREYPWLSTVQAGTTADCALSGLSDAAGELGVEDATEGCAALLAAMIGLLITFIGEDLTLRFVRQAWPDLSFSKLSEGKANE